MADAAAYIGWQGDLRHLPMVGGLPTRTTPYLAIKQDNNGDTFLISPTEVSGIDEHALVTRVSTRAIGAWAPDEIDGPDQPAF